MEIIDIFVECPSGLNLSFRGALNADLDEIAVSEHLASIVRASCAPGEDAVISAFINDQWRTLALNDHGRFSVAPAGAVEEAEQSGLWRRISQPIVAPTSDQAQQLGRFLHALAVASLVGAIGLWHSTRFWTSGDVLSELNLCIAFVVTFYVGLRLTKGV
ncbi:hypothetical protein HHL24_26875 [Paraburkholderia sp. RP-4-7]|uniref:Uncharacterized protein n=1 Tax=Paraburkholderia polaris TaxID=2728848 RepID=A0A848IMY4_9BURK|nr:hypothetical protein [Paraburkholderia polaris]NMM01549.1 hypothetical protein [Paraburkholderia polaris]